MENGERHKYTFQLIASNNKYRITSFLYAKKTGADPFLETEIKLAFADCAQIPLHKVVETPDDVIKLEELKPMEVDFEALTKEIQEIQPYLKEWMGYQD